MGLVAIDDGNETPADYSYAPASGSYTVVSIGLQVEADTFSLLHEP